MSRSPIRRATGSCDQQDGIVTNLVMCSAGVQSFHLKQISALTYNLELLDGSTEAEYCSMTTTCTDCHTFDGSGGSTQPPPERQCPVPIKVKIDDQ